MTQSVKYDDISFMAVTLVTYGGLHPRLKGVRTAMLKRRLEMRRRPGMLVPSDWNRFKD